MSKIPNWLKIAESQRGQKEIRGGENPKIIEYHDSCTLHAKEDEIPWCSAFVNWCMQKCGFKGTRSAAAKSWLQWGRELADTEYQPGAIVVFDWQNGSGHVGFMYDWDENGVTVLGGNQSDTVNETRFKWDNVVGVRWPAYTKVVMVDE